jgi:hypothetical protein
MRAFLNSRLFAAIALGVAFLVGLTTSLSAGIQPALMYAAATYLAFNGAALFASAFNFDHRWYNLAPACLPRVVSVSSACGCTLTATSIKGLTPNEMASLANKEIDLARVILNAAEAKVLGVQENGLATFLRSTIKDIKPKLNTSKIDEQSIILPYIQRTQRSYINANYFTIEAGVATTGAGTGVIPASSWDLTLNLGASWLKTDLAQIERYFKPGNTLIVLTWDSTSAKNAKTLVFTITAAVNADAGGTAKAKVSVVPNITDVGFLALANDAAGRGRYRPTFGVAQTGANDISDRESWCHEPPADLSRKILVNWIQTTRTSRCVDETYLRILDQIMKGKVNPYQQGFVWSPLAEQNKRKAMLEENDWMRSVFFGQAINEKQTPETYDQLPTITDVADTNCPLEYKARALGFFQILTDCNRVVDLNGGALDLDYIFQQLYYLMRNRQADGDKISVIDSLTDRYTAAKIYDAMSRYYRVRYNVETVRHAKIGEKITHEGTIMFNYNLYDIPEVGIQWAVFHDPFFDDHLSAFPATVSGVNFKARGRNLWFLDFSDMVIGIGKTMSVRRKTPDEATNSLYNCVITANHKEFNLRSQKWTAMLDRPQRHLIIHNFSDACPTVTAQSDCSAIS